MKIILSIFALVVGLAFTVPAFAAGNFSEQKTREACMKVGGYWHAKTKTCSGKTPH
jgi:hypothetical protein